MLENCYQHELLEAGCDEAGRGCLAGSVFAAAVILPKDFHHPLLNDSKQLTERRRNMLREIIEREAVAWAVAEVTAERIDEINILRASFEGMNIAVANCLYCYCPEIVVVQNLLLFQTIDLVLHSPVLLFAVLLSFLHGCRL